jgi:hypothetical protein
LKWGRSGEGEPISLLGLGDTDFPRACAAFGNARPERRSARSTIYRRPIAEPELFEADGHAFLLNDRPDSQCAALRKEKAARITGS